MRLRSHARQPQQQQRRSSFGGGGGGSGGGTRVLAAAAQWRRSSSSIGSSRRCISRAVTRAQAAALPMSTLAAGSGRPGAAAALAAAADATAAAAAGSPPAPAAPLDPAHAYVRLAHRLADAAGAVTGRYFRSSTLNVDAKADDSPVTVADREAEAAMRALLRAEVPAHAVFGEEHGLELGGQQQQEDGEEGGEDGGGSGGAEWLWVLDPIDGTKSFITGKPLFGTLIALLHNGAPVLGIIDQPVTRERWVGLAGHVTTLNGRPVSTRRCAGGVGAAYLYATTPHMFAPGATEQAFARLRGAVRTPLYGCDCYAYGLLAAGHVDLVCEADLKPYDYMALAPVVQGAGGVITDWAGAPLRWDVRDGDVAAAVGAAPGEVLAAGDAAVHAQALELLGWGK